MKKLFSLWASLWLVSTGAAAVLLGFQWNQWRANVDAWPAAIAESRARGDLEMVAKQQAWLARDQAAGLVTVILLGVVFLALAAVPAGYFRLVPRERRAGIAEYVLAVPVLGLIGWLGYLALGFVFRGAIKG